MIDILGVSKRYGPRTVVDGLSFTVRPGAVTGFLGPNGAGKSTTMGMMLGLTAPDAGSARIDGVAYRELRYPVRRVGALLENAAPHPSLTAADHLRWLAQSNRVGKRRVVDVLDQVGLADAARQRVGTFSLGMRQRLGLAAALLGDPGVLVLDEPMNGLDTERIRWLRDLLRAMAGEGRTVLVSSHLMSEISALADQLIVIRGGVLLSDSSMADFIERHARTFVRVRGSEIGRLAGELERNGASLAFAGDGAVDVTGLTAVDVNRLATAGGVVLSELSTHADSLEDAFLELVGAEGAKNRG